MVKEAITIKFLFNTLRTCEDVIGKCKTVNGKYKTVNVKPYTSKCEIIILSCHFYTLTLKFIPFIVDVCKGNTSLNSIQCTTGLMV